MKRTIAKHVFAAAVSCGLLAGTVVTATPAQAIGPLSADICQKVSGDTSFPSSAIAYNYVDGLGYSHGDSVAPGECSGNQKVTIVKLRVNRKYQVNWYLPSTGASGTRWVNANKEPSLDLRKGTKINILDVDNV